MAKNPVKPETAETPEVVEAETVDAGIVPVPVPATPTEVRTDMCCNNGNVAVENMGVDAFIFGDFQPGDPIVEAVIIVDVRSDAGILLAAGVTVPVAGSKVQAMAAAQFMRLTGN